MLDCNINNYPELLKSFKIIAFDWDGTAVENRKVDATLVTSKLEDLLKLGIYIVIVTGTNFDNINNQSTSLIQGLYKQNLFVCTNRGSEVYGFNKDSEPILIYRREASQKENMLLDKIAESSKKLIEGASVTDIQIIYNRLNRRKIDLIPEWSDPQKSEIDKLLETTSLKLDKQGFSGGIHKAFKQVKDLAKSLGLNNAKVTSDVKHIEIGLTDKEDSIRWVLANIAEKNKILNSEILIGGDEFGMIAGFQGSDDKMVIKNEPDITYFSVGVEPNGTPPSVINLGGGPDCFVKVLELQISML